MVGGESCHEHSSVSALERPSRRPVLALLAAIVIAGAILRLVDLRRSPPGLNQDEAANAWNAYCVLKTGCDQTGSRWPIFYTRGLGENRSTLFLYCLIPFQALGGLNVWTTRLPSAVGGVLTLLLTYYIGARLFGRTTGLVAAAFLAFNPWHLQQTRWGHEAAICPLLVTGTLAMMLWANLPLDDDDSRRPRPLRAALAGILAGISCYGYPALLLFMPPFLLLILAVTVPGWWRCLRDRRGAAAIAAWLIALSITAGPLYREHITDASRTGRRLQFGRVWNEGDPFATKVLKVLERYPGHFGPHFLFTHGDDYEIQSPPASGSFHLYALPLMLAGLVATLRRTCSSPASRVLLAWVIAYPLGDCFAEAEGIHALRSLPGLCALVLLAAVGAVRCASWLYPRYRRLAWATAGVFAAAAISLNVHFLYRFFGEFNRRPTIYHLFHVDLMEACDWLRPRMADTDAVFCTPGAMNMPYLITLVALGYDPHQWFRDRPEFVNDGFWDHCVRYGKMRFVYDKDAAGADLNALLNNGRRDRVIIIVRPAVRQLHKPAHTILDPAGNPTLLIYDEYY